MKPLRIGTRGSDLARVQTEFVKKQIQRVHPELVIEVEIIRTLGDTVQDRPLHQIGDDGLFIKAIETALHDKHIDVAVHSMKDLPSAIPDGLALGAIPRRYDPRDAFIGRNVQAIEQLEDSANVATGSLRRRSQLLHWRPKLRIEPIRGNVPTRIAKFDASEWDGMILAVAGLERLGLSNRIGSAVSTMIMLPAVGQGALAVEIREGDQPAANAIACLHDEDTAVAVAAERALLRDLEGGCQVPIAGHATLSDGRIRLEGFVGSPDGTRTLRDSLDGDPSKPDEIGRRLAERLLERGARDIVASGRDISNSQTTPET